MEGTARKGNNTAASFSLQSIAEACENEKTGLFPTRAAGECHFYFPVNKNKRNWSLIFYFHLSA